MSVRLPKKNSSVRAKYTLGALKQKITFFSRGGRKRAKEPNAEAILWMWLKELAYLRSRRRVIKRAGLGQCSKARSGAQGGSPLRARTDGSGKAGP